MRKKARKPSNSCLEPYPNNQIGENQNKGSIKSTAYFILLFTLTSCASPKVIQFLNKDLDYSLYHTYRLIHYKSDDKSFAADGMAFYNQIESAIEDKMKVKGYTIADRPDLIARYEIVSTTTTETNSRNYDPYGYNYYLPPPTSRKYTEGIVLIELRDRKQKKLVWQGSLDLKYKMRSASDVAILESINKIFESYPYKAGSNEKITSKE